MACPVDQREREESSQQQRDSNENDGHSRAPLPQPEAPRMPQEQQGSSTHHRDAHQDPTAAAALVEFAESSIRDLLAQLPVDELFSTSLHQEERMNRSRQEIVHEALERAWEIALEMDEYMEERDDDDE